MPSSVVLSLSYDLATQTLRIEFTSGKIYAYQKVPEAIYEEMKMAKSKGIFLNQFIKGKFSFVKVET